MPGLLAGVALALLAFAPALAKVSDPDAALVARRGFPPAHVGWILVDLDDGRRLAAHRPDAAFIPASTTKVTTMIAALEILGAEYRFETALLATGEVRDGTLEGDLYLRGGGDPTLATEHLEEMVRGLAAAGVARVAGAFSYDTSLLLEASAIDPSQPDTASYNPGVSALSVNYNRVGLTWRHAPGSAKIAATLSSPARSRTLPVTGITTGPLPPGHDPRYQIMHDGAARDRWLLSPALAPSGHIELPVKKAPGHLAADLFRDLAARHGVALPAPRAGTTPAGARLLYVHRSASLAEIAAGVLKHSNNLSAELIGQVTARRLGQGPVSLEESAATLAAWYRRRLPDVDWTGFVAANHSGLTSASRHSPRQLVAVLRHGAALRPRGEPFSRLLIPVPYEGEGGRGEARGKSGTMYFAGGLAGYVTSARGRRLAYAVLFTDQARRAALDAVLDGNLAAPPRGARSWVGRARGVARALVGRWVAAY